MGRLGQVGDGWAEAVTGAGERPWLRQERIGARAGGLPGYLGEG